MIHTIPLAKVGNVYINIAKTYTNTTVMYICVVFKCAHNCYNLICYMH